MGRPEHELVRALVVEVDEARVRPERRSDLVRDRLEHLLEVERRVDDLGRAGQQREVAGGFVHRRSSLVRRHAAERLPRQPGGP